MPGGFFIGGSIFRMNYLQILFLIVTFGLKPPDGLACDFVNVTGGGFGQSDGGSQMENRAIANLELRCGDRFRVGLDGGLHHSNVRRMSDGKGNFVSYFLWQDGASNVEWGSNGLPAVVPYPAEPLLGEGNGSSQSFPVYGAVVPSDLFTPGVYTDIVRVFLEYASSGQSETIEADLRISLDVLGDCTLSIEGLGNFGQWPAGSSNLEGVALGAITVRCNPPGMSFSIGIGGGMNMRGGIRHMRSGDDFVPYVVYADPGRTERWGDGGISLIEPGYVETHPAAAQTEVSTGSSQNFPVWGDAMIQALPGGAYRDTVTVTIAWR